MKTIGIVTMFHNNVNYGGNLQAYALCRYLNQNGFKAEQIRFVTAYAHKEGPLARAGRLLGLGLDYLYLSARKKRRARARVETVSLSVEVKREHKARMKARGESFEAFSAAHIPYTDEVYFADTVETCASRYDALITGSDQVWNFNSYNSIYFLAFAPHKQKKLSYAASFSMDRLLPWQKRRLRRHLRDFDAISVREENALSFLSCAPESVPKAHVVDPTLLLTREDWEEITDERLVKEKYLFCYFLGENEKERELAAQYAKEKGLLLVTIPHAGGGYRTQDEGFGEVLFPHASPSAFLSLVRYADCVFTDSFHAVVFSHIFERQYFVFNRDARKKMTSRIKSITTLFESEARYCENEEREQLCYLLSLPAISYERDRVAQAVLRAQSVAFLSDHLGESI